MELIKTNPDNFAQTKLKKPALVYRCKRCGKLVIFEDGIASVPIIPNGFICEINEITHWCDNDKTEIGIIELVGYSFSD